MKDLSSGKVSKMILQFATPMILGNIFQQMYNIVDSIIIGNYIGKEALAAVGASFPLMFALISFIIGIASGSTIVISQYFGAKDIEKVKRAIDTLYIFLFFASILLSVVGIIFSKQIFELMALPAEIMPFAETYFNIYISGIILFFGFNGTSAILRGIGDSKTPLYFLIISTIVNILLDLLFVIVFGWGISGVAIATIIAQGIAFILIIWYLNKTHKIIRISMFGLKFDKEIFRKSLKIGLPTSFQQTFVAFGMIALFRIVNDFGTNVIAAFSIAFRIDSFVAMPAMNFSAALAVFVGQNLGAGKPKRAKEGLVSTLIITTTFSIIISIIILVLGKYIMQMFTSDVEVIKAGVKYLWIVAPFYILFSTMFAFNGVLRGAGDTLIPMFITLFALWIIRIPVSWFLSEKMGETGIWWGIPIAWFFGAFLSYLYFLSGKWKTKVIVKTRGK